MEGINLFCFVVFFFFLSPLSFLIFWWFGGLVVLYDKMVVTFIDLSRG